MTGRLVTLSSVLLLFAAAPLAAELIGPAVSSSTSASGSEDWGGPRDGWRAELMRMFSESPADSGELMAVVLPGPPQVVPPPVVPPPVTPPVVPPPVGGGAGRSDDDQIEGGIAQPPVTPIPEPGSMVLLAIGVSGAFGCRYLRRRRG